MKATIKIIAIISLLVLGLVGCRNDDNEAHRLEVYILRYAESTNDLLVDERPIFTQEDILSYEWGYTYNCF